MIRQFARHYAPDKRDEKFRIPTWAVALDARTYRYWNTGWWTGDQGSTPRCVGFSVAHFLAAHPIRQMLNPNGIYAFAQQNDEWVGESYDGTSVRAGVKVAQRLGMVESYWWAKTLQEMVDTLLEIGPIVLGTNWMAGMMETDKKGFIHATGAIHGGHAYLCCGVNVTKGFFKIKNSWGENWGKKGYAKISFDDMALLLAAQGEACVPVEKRAWE